MKKGNVIFSKGTHNLYEILTKGVGGYMGGLDSQDLKDLYHLIGEELGEDCQNKKCYAVKMMLHRENPTILDIIENTEWKDYLKEEPSQPLKEEEGEMKFRCCTWHGKEKECECPCHQEKETEKETHKKLPSDICYCGHPKKRHNGESQNGYRGFPISGGNYNEPYCFNCSCKEYHLDETAKL